MAETCYTYLDSGNNQLIHQLFFGITRLDLPSSTPHPTGTQTIDNLQASGNDSTSNNGSTNDF